MEDSMGLLNTRLNMEKDGPHRARGMESRSTILLHLN